MIKIIGVCGKKFNGKDTIADYLVNNFGFIKISFGDSLKRASKDIFGFSDEQLWGNKKEIVDDYWGITPREILQFIGTDCLRVLVKNKFPSIEDNIWIMSLEKQLQKIISDGITKIVIPDVRFPNEEQMIRKYNGEIIRVVRCIDNNSDLHISENSLDLIKHDYVIYNQTLPQLYETVDHIMKLVKN